MKAFPVQVVEEVVRKSLKGQHVAYTIMMPDKKQTVTSLDDVNCNVFEDVVDLEEFMINNAKASIRQIINNATTLQSIFGKDYVEEDEKPLQGEEVQEQENEESVQTSKNNSKIKIDIGNGIKANINAEDLEGMTIFNR